MPSIDAKKLADYVNALSAWKIGAELVYNAVIADNKHLSEEIKALRQLLARIIAETGWKENKKGPEAPV